MIKWCVLCVVITLIPGSCSRNQPVDTVSAATARKGPPARVLLEGIMPGAMADGIVKIAVLVNQEAGDNARQFIEGAVSEGREMGFTVDFFTSGGNEERCRAFAEGIGRSDYDGLIFAYGEVDFSYDILRPIADSGVRIVTFEARPYRDGRYIQGLVTTYRDDYSLARLSLETLLSYTGSPARLIRLGSFPGITFLDRRAWVFDEFVHAGLIEEAALIRMPGLENPHTAAREALAAILPDFPPGSLDGLWVPWDDFARGCAEALFEAGRHDITMTSIGISNEDLHIMLRHSDFWLASTAIDPALAGTVTMRILAASLAGETLDNTFSFSPQLVKTADLNPAVNIANLPVMVPDWGDGQGLFDHYPWMADLKEAGMRYLRIPPVTVAP